MKYIALWIFACFSAIGFCQNQKPTATKLNTIAVDADDFLGYDSFGFYYTLKNDVFSKINGSERLDYKNISLGKITKVDLQNPLKLVLFYENFNTFITLDNQLNETQKINFSENAIPIVATAVGLASQNQVWVYNSMNQQIGLYDYLNQNYKILATPLTENITFYNTDFNLFQWIDTANNWYACDIFGKIRKINSIPDFDCITLLNDTQYIYSKSGELYFVDIVKEQKTQFVIFEKTFIKFHYKDQILSIFTTLGISNYKITIP
jgi:hypothetical protein